MSSIMARTVNAWPQPSFPQTTQYFSHNEGIQCTVPSSTSLVPRPLPLTEGGWG